MANFSGSATVDDLSIQALRKTGGTVWCSLGTA